MSVDPAWIEHLISAFGYANRHPEDAARIERTYKALRDAVVPVAAALEAPLTDEQILEVAAKAWSPTTVRLMDMASIDPDDLALSLGRALLEARNAR